MSKVGLVGYDCHTGLGELNRQLDCYCDLELWLKKTHSHWPSAIESNARKLDDKFADSLKVAIEQCDVLLFCETPYFPNLIPLARAQGKRTVCVPMLEWTPRGKWTVDVDLFICPTKQCYDILSADGLPCVHFPWPVDTDRFSFVQRNECKRFLFLNGRGGWHGRKGWDAVRQALEVWPEMPLTVISQVDIRIPEQAMDVVVLPSVEDNNELYQQGDVLIAPHTVDGIGLEPWEAMACGMLVITPDASPWNENPALFRIPTMSISQAVSRPMDWHLSSPNDIVNICKEVMTMGLGQESIEVRRWAEKRSWATKRHDFMNLVKGVTNEAVSVRSQNLDNSPA